MSDQKLICPKCKKRTYVAVERNSFYETGWGCLNCKTAVIVKQKCSVCNKAFDIYVRVGVKLNKFICKKCITKLNNSPVIFSKKIPTWRLNLDDATPYEIITKPLSTFGTPYMSEQKWKEFYSQPHEIAKQRKTQQAIKEMKKESIKKLITEKNK